MILAVSWYWILVPSELVIGGADLTATTSMVVPVCAVFHSILAAVVLNRVWDEYTQTCDAICENDKERFLKIYRNRIPTSIHILLAAMSAFIVLNIMILEYGSGIHGCLSIGSIAFFLVLYWEVATTLDDPLKSPWLNDSLPPSFREAITAQKQSPPY